MKTRDLTGAALDWAVAKCEGRLYGIPGTKYEFRPSVNWAHGGPIVERMFSDGLRMHTAEFITGVHDKNLSVASLNGDVHVGFYFGPTPLIAAMRCYAASKLGDEIDVPDYLISEEVK